MKSMPIGHHGITGPGARLGALAALALGLLLLPAGAAADEFTVINSDDSGAGSLRQALAAANGNNEPDTITFDLPDNDRVILLSGTQLTIANDTAGPDLTIDGDLDDDGTPDVTVKANGSRVFSIASGAEATLEGLVITGGGNVGFGVGIFNLGTLTVTNSTISGNSADFGAGIFNFDGTLTVTNSTISGNSATSGGGGGIGSVGTLTVTNSTISGNSALGGGGIVADGTVTVTNSTISGNSVANSGGGIFSAGTLTVANSTISGNSAGDGGGIFLFNGTLTVANSTISGNSAAAGAGGILIFDVEGTTTVKSTIVAGNTQVDCFGAVISDGFNLEGGTSCGFMDLTDEQNVAVGDVLVTDANGPLLTDNGGPTQTIALVDTDTNPALDAIPLADCTVTVDQRGVSRPQPADGNCDIGAFELVQEAPVTIADLIELFDDAVAAGDLVGAGPGNSAAGRLNALRNMLLAAGDLLEQGDVDGACAQLQDAADRTDGASPPDDFVQGPAAPDLLGAITELQDELGCSA